MTYRLIALLLLAGGLASGITGVATTAAQPAASASAYAISVVVPGQAGSSAGGAVASGAGSTSGDAFSYPADGSIARTGALSSSASTSLDAGAAAYAVTDVLGISLFNGEITLDSAAGRARSSTFGADTTGSGVGNLLVAGQAVSAVPNRRVALGDWGTLVTLEEGATHATGTTVESRSSVTAVRVTLTTEHGGLPAGSEILIGHAETAISAPVPEVAPATTAATPAKPPTPPKSRPKPPAPSPTKITEKLPEPPEPGKDPVPKVRTPPTNISAPLSPAGYVFPVYGPSSYSDTYGAARAAP